MKNWCENFVLAYEVDMNKFLCIEITPLVEKRFKIPQPFLFKRIIYFINIDTNSYGLNTNAKSIPVGKPLLHKYVSGKLRKE